LLCLFAVTQSFLVDTFIFSITFSTTQIAIGGAALFLVAAKFAAGAKSESQNKEDERQNNSYLTG
jgi:small neutral amino acid transporter SnatA (MarC family)